MDVFMVWHVRHAKFSDGSSTQHFDERGELSWDEQSGDDLKLLGAYGTEAEAEGRITRARRQPGFTEEPDCFLVDIVTLGEDRWTEGFITVPHESQEGEGEGPSNPQTCPR